MTALSERIARLIRFNGPISVAQYMTMALHDPALGYYAAKSPIGAKGDFITAPEISQMFGELLGAWIVQAWREQKIAQPCRLVELGPGRGTLMADVVRTARQLDREFLASTEIVLVEASDTLRAAQEEVLRGVNASADIRWYHAFDETLTDRPLFLLANEFFDALPIRQFVLTERGWCERLVGVDEKDRLAFALSPFPIPLTIPADRGPPEIGSVYEIAPSGEAIVEQIALSIARSGGAALIVDYGYGTKAGFGDTLQAVSHHKYAGVLEQPGTVDISAHVDFSALARATQRAGAAAYGPMPQGELLQSLGVVLRAEEIAQAAAGQGVNIAAALERLVSPEQMGSLFKALAILPAGAPPAPGF